MTTQFEFWFRVDKRQDCWLWLGSVNNYGYGTLGHNKKVILAHRYAWEITNGAIPDGLLVCHSCDNPPCVNPDHLFLGTHTDNLNDCISKGRFTAGKAAGRNRANRTHCKYGHEFSTENTYINAKGYRICRLCLKWYNEHRDRRTLLKDESCRIGTR